MNIHDDFDEWLSLRSTSVLGSSGRSQSSTRSAKLDLSDDWCEVAFRDFTELPITAEHARRAGELPPHHRDPFDRMLIAQALAEGLTVVTANPAFEPYAVPRVW